MSETHKYYWLKLKRDFFKRHDIVIIESMANGKDYILFYLKLLCESVDHEGNLRFSETIPYSEDMLAMITRTNVDIVRSAVKVFSELGMMDRFDDGTLFMSQVDGMIGYVTNDAIRMRESRLNRKQLLIGQEKSECCSLLFKKRSPELELELELDKEKDNIRGPDKPARPPFRKPTIEEVTEYCRERKNTISPEGFIDHYKSQGWKVGKNAMKDWRAAIRTWERNDLASKPLDDEEEKQKAGLSAEAAARRAKRIEEVLASGRYTAAEAERDPWHPRSGVI